MKTSQLTEYSKNLIKGMRIRSFAYAAAVLSVPLFFRLAEAAGAGIVLYCTDIKPTELLFSDNMIWRVFTIICTLLKYIASAPLIIASAGWFTDLCRIEKELKFHSLSEILSDCRMLGKSIAVMLAVKLVLMLFFLPSGIFVGFAWNMIFSGSSRGIFYGIHCVSMALLSVGMWIWAMLGMAAVPFVAARNMHAGVWAIISQSFRIMKGRRKGLIRIAVLKGIPMLALVTIPFMLGSFFAAVSLYINICIKEAEYDEWVKVHSKNGNTDNASELSAWKDRNFKTSADKAETPE